MPSTLQLESQTRQRLLEAARRYAPDQVAAEETEEERVRQATADLTGRRPLGASRGPPTGDGRVGRYALTRPGAAAGAPGPGRALRFEAALALAHPVLADRDEPDQGDQVRSVVDPDARCGTHGAYFAGYRLDSSVDADSERLTALNLLPGNGDEARDAQTLLAAEQRVQGHTVAAVSIDGIAWNGEVSRALSAPQGVGVEVYVPPPPRRRRRLFPPRRCPGCPAGRGDVSGGQQTATKERVPTAPGEVCLCPPPVCRVSAASVVLGYAAPEEGAECDQA